ncbi:hypothetical protein E1A91_A11G339100v1, partial [Gossypium mustelinum]
IADFFSLPLDDAASTLGVCTSVLKKICRENGLDRWLHCKPDAGLAAAILMQNLRRISMAATAYSKGELEYAAYLSDQVTYLFDKMEECLGIVLLEALQNGAAVLDLKKLENLFYYIFDT